MQIKRSHTGPFYLYNVYSYSKLVLLNLMAILSAKTITVKSCITITIYSHDLRHEIVSYC